MNLLVIPTLALALLLFVCGQHAVHRCRTLRSKLGVSALWFLLGIPGFCFPLYYLHCFDDAKWFHEFRSLPFTELTAAGAGLFVGALAEFMARSKLLFRALLIAMLCLGVLAPHMKPVLAPVPSGRYADRWNDDVCMQSTLSSCGAASAATVFRTFGINLSEGEIARECFTYRGGTENWYLARAFRGRGCTVTYRLEQTFPTDLKTPAIAGVRIGGAGHYIAILGRTDGKYVTANPLVGRREVPADRMTTKYDFTGFYMEIQR